MTNKRYILIIIVFFVSFFALNNIVFAETKDLTCNYYLYVKDGKKVTENKNEVYVMNVKQVNQNNPIYYFDNNDAYLYTNDGSTPYYKYGCPAYIVNFAGLNDEDPNAYQKFYAYDKDTQFSKITNKIKYAYNYQETTGGSDYDDKNSYQCKFDKYYYDFNSKSYVSEGTSKNQSITVHYVDDVDPETHNDLFTKVSFFLPGMGDSYHDPNGDGIYQYGDRNSTIKLDAFRPNYCPQYLIPTNTNTEGYADIYDTNTTETDIQNKTKSFFNMYYKKSAEQEQNDATNASQNSHKCAYYLSDIKMTIELVRSINGIGITSFDVNVTKYEGVNSAQGTKLVGSIQNYDTSMLTSIVDEKKCSDYPFVEVHSSGETSINLSLYKNITDVKKTFKYYKLAKTKEEADIYIAQLTQAYGLIEDIISAMKGNKNGDIENIFREAAKQENAPEDIQNVVTYLDIGGKINKAIYDYTSYWYAQASNYAGFYVVDEGADSSLKTTAQSLISLIEANVKEGYIPIPDGCSMISQDLIDFLAWGLRIIRYAAVAITIILGMVDFFRAIAESDDKAFQKAGGRFLKRIIAVVLIFLSALFIQFILYNYALPGIGEDEINLCNIVNSK